MQPRNYYCKLSSKAILWLRQEVVGPIIGFASLIIVCLATGAYAKLIIGGIILVIILADEAIWENRVKTLSTMQNLREAALESEVYYLDMEKEMKHRFVLIGSGNLATIIANAYRQGLMPDYEMAAVLGTDRESTERIASSAGCSAVYDIRDVLQLKPEYVVEAAAVGAVKAYLKQTLSAGISFVALSIGAFADEGFLDDARRLAQEHGVKIHLPSGAIGGFDVLRTISMMDHVSMEFTMNKSRVNMVGTSLYDKCPEAGEAVTIFEGTAAEAIELLPGHVNVAVASALATVGPEKMKVVIYSDPEDPDDVMHSIIKSDKASAHLTIRSVPADIAAWSVVALMNNLVSPVQFA